LDKLVGAFPVALEDDVGDDGLALVLVVPADDGGLGYGPVADQGALDLGRSSRRPRGP
jgi:hypothetical protein